MWSDVDYIDLVPYEVKLNIIIIIMQRWKTPQKTLALGNMTQTVICK